MPFDLSLADIFGVENEFYRRADPSRISKFLSHAKLYEMSLGLPGHFLEAGVFRGASFCRFRKLARLFQPDHARSFFGFDVFGRFPAAEYEEDRAELARQIELSGDLSIDVDTLRQLLNEQGLGGNVELIKGDVCKTLPAFLASHRQLSFAIVNIDLDLYEPTRTAVRELYPRLVRNGIMILDDYEGFPGAKQAVDEYFADAGIQAPIRKFSFALSPCYVVKP